MAASGDLVSALETSLQECVSAMLVTEKGRIEEGSDTEKQCEGIEEKVTKFLQAARNLEADFLAKQFYSRVQHPQEVEKQDISEMKTELAKKEELISKLSDKIDHWGNRLQNLQIVQASIKAADVS